MRIIQLQLCIIGLSFNVFKMLAMKNMEYIFNKKMRILLINNNESMNCTGLRYLGLVYMEVGSTNRVVSKL